MAAGSLVFAAGCGGDSEWWICSNFSSPSNPSFTVTTADILEADNVPTGCGFPPPSATPAGGQPQSQK